MSNCITNNYSKLKYLNIANNQSQFVKENKPQ